MSFDAYTTAGQGQNLFQQLCIQSVRDPVDGVDFNDPTGGPYQIGRRWFNKTNGNYWRYAGQGLWILDSSSTGPLLEIGVPAGTSPISPDINGLVNFTSNAGTLTISGSAGGLGLQNINFDLSGGGVGIDSVQVQAATAPGVNPVVPTAAGLMTVNGATVAAHSVPLETRTRATNTWNIEAQVASLVSPTPVNTNSVGLACYNTNQFQLDATSGMVSLKGSTTAAPILTTTGDDAVAVGPSGTGNLNVIGNVTANAAHAKPVYVVNSAANTERVDVQLATVVSPTPINSNSAGLVCLNTNQFQIDATSGMVSLKGSTTLPPVLTLTGDTGGAIGPTAGGNISTLGGGANTGVVTAGSANQMDFSVYRWVAPSSNNWTPVVAGSTGAGVGTYVKQHGVYSRVGNMIFFTFDLQWSAHTGTGNMLITGFPKQFALANTNYPYLAYVENITLPAGTIQVVFNGANSTTQGSIQANIDAATNSPVVMDGTGTICCYGFYFSDQA